MTNPDGLQPGAGAKLKAALLGASGSGVLFAASLAVPLIGFIAGFMAAAPLGYARLTGGRFAAIISAVLAALLVALGFKPLLGTWYLAQCGLIGLLLPELLLQGQRPSRALFWSTTTAALASAAVALLMTNMAGQEIQTLAQKEIATAMQQAMAFYEQQKGLSAQDIEAIKHSFQMISDLLLRIYPALACLNLFLLSGITLTLFQRMTTQRCVALPIPRFVEFRTPEPIIWLLIFSGFAMLAPQPQITTPALNILVFLAVLYFLQGLAVLLVLCSRTAYSGVLRVLLAIALLLQPYLIPLVVLLGVFDLWGEFRSPQNKQEENL